MGLFAFFYLRQFAFTCTGGANDTLFGLVPWYEYLTPTINAGGCDPRSFQNFQNTGGTGFFGAQSPILLIGLAILDDLIRIAALIAVGYVIYGGIQYVTSQGSPDATRKAQQTIINALIGVTVAILAAAIVGFIGNSLVK